MGTEAPDRQTPQALVSAHDAADPSTRSAAARLPELDPAEPTAGGTSPASGSGGKVGCASLVGLVATGVAYVGGTHLYHLWVWPDDTVAELYAHWQSVVPALAPLLIIFSAFVPGKPADAGKWLLREPWRHPLSASLVLLVGSALYLSLGRLAVSHAPRSLPRRVGEALMRGDTESAKLAASELGKKALYKETRLAALADELVRCFEEDDLYSYAAWAVEQVRLSGYRLDAESAGLSAALECALGECDKHQALWADAEVHYREASRAAASRANIAELLRAAVLDAQGGASRSEAAAVRNAVSLSLAARADEGPEANTLRYTCKHDAAWADFEVRKADQARAVFADMLNTAGTGKEGHPEGWLDHAWEALGLVDLYQHRSAEASEAFRLAYDYSGGSPDMLLERAVAEMPLDLQTAEDLCTQGQQGLGQPDDAPPGSKLLAESVLWLIASEATDGTHAKPTPTQCYERALELSAQREMIDCALAVPLAHALRRLARESGASAELRKRYEPFLERELTKGAPYYRLDWGLGPRPKPKHGTGRNQP